MRVVYSKSDIKRHKGLSVSTRDAESIEELRTMIREWFEEKA